MSFSSLVFRVEKRYEYFGYNRVIFSIFGFIKSILFKNDNISALHRLTFKKAICELMIMKGRCI